MLFVVVYELLCLVLCRSSVLIYNYKGMRMRLVSYCVFISLLIFIVSCQQDHSYATENIVAVKGYAPQHYKRQRHNTTNHNVIPPSTNTTETQFVCCPLVSWLLKQHYINTKQQPRTYWFIETNVLINHLKNYYTTTKTHHHLPNKQSNSSTLVYQTKLCCMMNQQLLKNIHKRNKN